MQRVQAWMTCGLTIYGYFLPQINGFANLSAYTCMTNKSVNFLILKTFQITE